jgi:hypothetical protein
MLLILAIQEMEAGGREFEAVQNKDSSQTLSQKQKFFERTRNTTLT